MEKQEIINKIESLGETIEADLTVGNVPDNVRLQVIEIVKMLDVYRKDNPNEIEECKEYASVVVHNVGVLFSWWFDYLGANKEIIYMPIQGLSVGNCLLDIWIDVVERIRGLEMSEDTRVKLNDLSALLHQQERNKSSNNGCFSVIVLVLVSLTSLVGLTCWGIYQLFA